MQSMNGWLRIGIAIVALVALGSVLKYTVLQPDLIPVTVFRVARGIVEETSLISAVCQEMKYPPIDLDKIEPDDKSLSSLSQEWASCLR